MALSGDIANSEVGLVPVLLLGMGVGSQLCSCAHVRMLSLQGLGGP